MEFQQRLYDLRKKAGLSQEGLADLLGVTRQAVQKWEAGASRPDMDNLAALARYFNVTLDYLVTGEEPPAPAAQTTIVNNYYQRWRYEYKSQRTLFGLPLVHVRLGDRGFGVAKGIFAVGNVAVGLFALGGISLGLFSLGGVSLGLLLALGGMSVGGIAIGACAVGLAALGGGVSFGLLFALGGWAMGALAIGGLAIGLLAIGGAAVGLFAMGGGAFGVYAAGGGAFASEIAIGGSASAPLAIGSQAASGALTFGPGADPAAVTAAIRQAAAAAPVWLQDLLISLALGV